jgi:hypothetical protein
MLKYRLSVPSTAVSSSQLMLPLTGNMHTDTILCPIASWNCGFEPQPGHGNMSCECVRCQVEISATGRSLVQRSPTDYGVSN